MPLHLVKLCVGSDSIADLAQWQRERARALRAAGQKPRIYHRTFQTPKRQQELLDGGSLYWVIRGMVEVRQRITGFGEGTKDDGSPCCLIYLDRKLVPVRPVPRRAFQGWRYLPADDAPPDLGDGRGALSAVPESMRRELSELGLL